MNRIRKKFSKIILLSMLGFSLTGNFITSVVLADNPNQHSAHHSLTGGWDKNLIGNSGKHWTRYTQRESNRQAAAHITITGYKRESGLGNYKTAYKKSARSVDVKHPHTHSGGAS